MNRTTSTRKFLNSLLKKSTVYSAGNVCLKADLSSIAADGTQVKRKKKPFWKSLTKCTSILPPHGESNICKTL